MSRKDYTRFSNKEPRKESQQTFSDDAELEVATEETPKIGIVTDCTRLNVRKLPNVKAEVLCTVNTSDNLEINEKKSTNVFYKVTTSNGVEGYCMKKYVTLLT